MHRSREEMKGGRRPPKRFFRLGGRFMAALKKPRKKIKNRKKRKLLNFSL
jgi:hypothetical protein